MTLPRKHIAEGIAVALMVGVGGTDGRLFADVAKLSAVEPSAKQRLAAMVAGRRSTGGRNITLSAIREALGPLVQVPRHADSDPRIDAAIVQQIFDATQGREAHTLSPLMVFSEEPLSTTEPIRIHERTSNAGDGSGLTLTSKHGRCYERVT